MDDTPKKVKPQLSVVQTGMPHWLLPPRVNPEHPITDADLEYVLEKMAEGWSLEGIVREHGGLPDVGRLRYRLVSPPYAQRYREAQKAIVEFWRDAGGMAALGMNEQGMPISDTQARNTISWAKFMMNVCNRDWYGENKQITLKGQIDIGSAMAKADERVLNASDDSGDVIEHEN